MVSGNISMKFEVYAFVGGGDSYGKSKVKGGKHKAHVDSFSHPLLVTSLKGHSGSVTGFDVSSSGKYLISVADGMP